MANQQHPVTIEVTRGSKVESVHEVSFALVDKQGKVLASAGDVEKEIYPRSAIKPLQAIALVESGAATAHGLSESELSLSCASHNGEARQVEVVESWLARLGLSADNLECGCQDPSYRDADLALVKAGQKAGRQHNNCSGKHSGFLTLATHCGYPTAGYINKDHPVQQRIMGVLETVFGTTLEGKDWGIDGCGIPTIAVPLGNMAMGLARFAEPGELPEAQQQACGVLASAIGKNPYFIAGSERLCTQIIEATKGRMIVKTGAEGVYAGSLLDSGLGLALKAHDGSKRASNAAILGLIEHFKFADVGAMTKLKSLNTGIERNWSGTKTGEIRLKF